MLDRVLGWLGLQRTSGNLPHGPDGSASGASGSLPPQGAPVHARFYYGPGGTSTTTPNISSYPPFPMQSIPPLHPPSNLPGNTSFASLFPGAPPQPWGSMQSFYSPPLWPPIHGYPHSGVPYLPATGLPNHEIPPSRSALSPPTHHQPGGLTNVANPPNHEAHHPGRPQVTQLSGAPHGHASTARPLSEEDKAADEFDWPHGDVVRERLHTAGDDDTRWKRTLWAWRSNGKTWHMGYRVERRRCLGVMLCAHCERPVRPKTDVNAKAKQLILGCPRPACPRNTLEVTAECDAETYHYQVEREGERYDVWKHFGHHLHPRPPRNGYLSKAEEIALQAQIKRRPDANAHQLRTGDMAPDSTPLADITPALADPRRARYQINKGREQLGLRATGSSKGGGPMLHHLAHLNKELGTPFLVHSGFTDRAFFIMQTPFMARVIGQAGLNWLDDFAIDGSKTGARNGFVTDGDHSYFRDGLLLTTCAFHPTLCAWVPVLYSWIDGQGAEDHRPHFRWLNAAIVSSAGSRFEPKLLSAVMDFSAAQRAAHAEEYAETMISLLKDWDKLSPNAQVEQRRAFVQEASEFLQGCEIHFWRSAKRLEKNGSLVPADQRDDFTYLLREMLSPALTVLEFDETVQTLRQDFPRIKNWISWWMQPLVSRMIFPAMKTMSESDARQLPRTSNPVETQHSLLHHASGKGHDLLPGVRALFLHMQEMERHEQAVLDGHVSWPSGPTNPPPRRPRSNFHPNDGRAPDTLDALEKDTAKPAASVVPAAAPQPPSLPFLVLHDPHNPHPSARIGEDAEPADAPQASSPALSGINALLGSGPISVHTFCTVDGSFPRSTPAPSFQLKSYTLTHNSCYTDHPIEGWFRAYVLWPPAVRQEVVRAVIPFNTVLSSLFFHFEARLKWILTGTTEIKGQQLLSLCQKIIKHAVFQTWKLVDYEDAFGCAYTWIQKAIQSAESEDTRQLFMIHHSAQRRCAEGHLSEDIIALPAVYSLRAKDIKLAHRHAQGSPKCATVTVSEYFRWFIPCRPMGNRHHGSDPIHDLPESLCMQDDCALTCAVTSIQTFWPRLLHIIPETLADTPVAFKSRKPPPVSFERTLSIPIASTGTLMTTVGLGLCDSSGDEDHRSPDATSTDTSLSAVVYTLVGRVLFVPGHFTAEYIVGDRTLAYDSAAHAGCLTDIGDWKMCLTPRHNIVMYIYTRRESGYEVTNHSIDVLRDDFEWLQSQPVSDQLPLDLDMDKTRPIPTPIRHSTAHGVAAIVEDTDTKQNTFSGVGPPGSPSLMARPPRSSPVTSFQDTPLHRKPITLPIECSPTLSSSLQGQSRGRTHTAGLTDIVDCAGACMEAVDEGPMVCCDICQRWSHSACVQFLLPLRFRLPSLDDDSEDEDYGAAAVTLHSTEWTWICPSCTSDAEPARDVLARHREALCGQFLLFKITPRSKHYPARLMHFDLVQGRCNFAWYEGNVYPKNSRARPPTFSRSIRECAQTFVAQRRSLGMRTPFSIGKIQWPHRLSDEAEDNYQYKNPEISSALADALPSIYNITSGRRDHPIMDRYRRDTPDMRIQEQRKAMDFATSCCFGILPGDASVIFTHMTELHKLLSATSGLSPDIPLTALAFGIGAVLFEVVILRIYLERPAEDDLAIYNLIMAQKDLNAPREATRPPPPLIERALSLPEQVVAAFDGVLDNKNPRHRFLLIFWKDNLQSCSEELKFDGAIARVVNEDGEAFQWPATGDPGLTGGGALPSLRAKAADGPPKPRPVKRARTARMDLENKPAGSTTVVPPPDLLPEAPLLPHVPLPDHLHQVPARQSKRLKMQAPVEKVENEGEQSEKGKGARSGVATRKRKRADMG
ncbi:hypothetical protein VTO73DRAFT_10357 [Trametes versicolor]